LLLARASVVVGEGELHRYTAVSRQHGREG
jgi:hypothetical protein